MKKQIFTLILIFSFLTISLNAQIFAVSDMENGLPPTWSNTGYSFADSDDGCQGFGYIQTTLDPTLLSSFIETPTQNSNGENINLSFDWRAIDFFGEPVDITMVVDYTTNGGSTYIPISNIPITEATSCAAFSTVILANDVPINTNFSLRITSSLTNPGDAFHIIDDVRVIQGCPGPSDVILLTDPSVVDANLSASCTDTDGWTYYSLEEGIDIYLFAVDWGSNNNSARDGAIITITVLGGTYIPPGNGPTAGSAALPRFWNVTLADGTSLNSPVKIKFYYDLLEVTDTQTAVSNSGEYNGFRWYKNNDGMPYTHDDYVTALNFIDNVDILTVDGSGTDNGIEYVEFHNITSFSGGSGASGAGGGFLPVTLLSFEGKTREESNLLTWSTATEKNTEWHIIERSPNGRNDWSEIGRVAAAGESNEKLHYELVDKSPLTEAYYRLTSLDYDSYKDLSKVVLIKRKMANGALKVYPNPVQQSLNMEFTTTHSENVEIKITDITGKVILSKFINSEKGLNKYQFSFVDINSGVYSISLSSPSQKITQRIIKH